MTLTTPGAGPRHGPAGDERAIREVLLELAAAVRDGADGRALDEVDVQAGAAAAVAMLVAGRHPSEVTDVAELVGETAADVGTLDLPAQARRTVDWSPFGVLVPVLSGSPGAGASVLAATITDALQLAGRAVLLVDADDPSRSGLAGAAATPGPCTSRIGPLLRIRYSWREHAVLARMESHLPVVTPTMVPPPRLWLSDLDPPHVTVVDIGHDGWRATANPLAGAGGWLRRGAPATHPILVVRPTRPSLRQAEQLLARLDPWVAFGAAAAPGQLVVTGARRWPADVTSAAGSCLAPLLESAVFLPHDYDTELGGVTDELTGDRLRSAVTPMLAGWGLLPPAGRSARRRR